MLRNDLHVHLYGCLTAEDLWELAKDSRPDEARLDYFADEYAKAFDKRPDWRALWQTSNPLELIRSWYIFDKPGPFSEFQARFNLSIALLPITTANKPVIDRLLSRHRGEGLHRIEYRCFMPPYFTDAQLLEYLTAIASKAEEYTSSSFKPSFAISLSRQDDLCLKQYNFLKSWQAAHPSLAAFITGVDFCHFEEGFPPHLKHSLFIKIHQDNAKNQKHALTILYHVGESFEHFSLMSSVRWVWQAAKQGAHRLGHAISLGVDPSILAGKQISEPLSERIDHLSWLLENQEWLKDQGYDFSISAVRAELSRLTATNATKVDFTYDQGLIEDCRNLQKAIMGDINRMAVVIESCPSSNFRIARIPSAKAHPLSRFLEHELKVCIATDDPGIFDLTLAQEEAFCRQAFALSEQQWQRLQNISETSFSQNLVRNE